jgi:thymidine kinase
MTTSNNTTGYLELFIGPMFSGKTSKLLEIYKQCKFCNIPVTIINHIIDNRYHETLVSTHDQITAPCLQASELNDIWTDNGYKKTGKISGDNMITDNIGYRYELSKPIDPNRGVNMDEYQALYKSNDGGSYNIDRNPDLFR